MKIGIDIRCLAEGRRTGVEEYTIRTLQYLFEQHPDWEFKLFYNSLKGNREPLNWLKKYPYVSLMDFRLPNKLLNFLFWFFHWPKIDRLLGGVEVLFIPNLNFLAFSSTCRSIVTLHDLSFERFPETFSFKRRLWHFLINPRKICQRTTTVVAVSESTADDVIGLYKIPIEKVKLCHPPLNYQKFNLNTLSPTEHFRLKKKYHLTDNFILYLGTIEPRKNIIGIINAFATLKEKLTIDNKLKLVIAGYPGWKAEQIMEQYYASTHHKDIIFLSFIPEDDKPGLYSLAQVFIYPSFFEGFGFPPLEAMAAGTPVITSNCSSIPEVVGDAALLIDPYRPYEITIALKALLDNPTLYQDYVERGNRQVEKMKKKSREVTIDKYFDI